MATTVAGSNPRVQRVRAGSSDTSTQGTKGPAKARGANDTQPPARRDWREELHRTANGEPTASLHNAMVVLEHAPEMAGVVAHDTFEGRTVVAAPSPWGGTGAIPRPITDVDVTRAAAWLAATYRVGTSADIVGRVIDAVADGSRRDPLREYLKHLRWDGKPRITRWLTTYLGVDGTDYTRAVGRAWLISAVARGLRPGCKADHVLVLEGRQGKRKSSSLRALFGNTWFKDDLRDMDHKDAQEELRGVWGLELAELDALGRSDLARVKRFLTQTSDNYRPAYGRHTVQHPRRCVFAATTNEADYLKDATGNRRFWPVAVGTIDVAAIERDRGQLWAEAVVAFEAGEPWWLDEGMEAQAAAEQEARRSVDPWEERLAGWLEQAHPEGITTADGLDRLDDGGASQRTSILRRTRAEVMRLAAIYQRYGYQHRRVMQDQTRVWRYFRA